MVGVVIGHGSHDGSESVVVPAGLTLHFFADEGTSMVMVNVLELLKQDNPRIPMHVAKPGLSVPNYVYDPFKEHERAAITALNQYPAPQIVVGSKETPNTLKLCANVKGCPTNGPHTCDGVLGRAARAKWAYLMVFLCRFDTRKNLPATLDLMAPHDKRDRSAHDALAAWVRTFVGLTTDRQDALWAGLTANERLRLIASDDEVREWDDCRAVRATMAAADPAKAAAVASTEIKIRLLRDYPGHRAAVRAGLRPDPADASDIAAFLSLSFDDKVDKWESLTDEAKARWMVDQDVTHWVAGFTACHLFRYGLYGNDLLGLLRRLEPPARAVAMSEEMLSGYLADNALRV